MDTLERMATRPVGAVAYAQFGGLWSEMLFFVHSLTLNLKNVRSIPTQLRTFHKAPQAARRAHPFSLRNEIRFTENPPFFLADMRHHHLSLDVGAAATGVNTRAPQLIVHQAALTLRQLLDAGVSAEDPRCRALLQLVNSARLLLLPTSNNGAKIASDLTAKAIHIDVSTATMAAIMGLKNTAQLTGAAVTEVINKNPKASISPPPQEHLTLRLLPQPAQKATDALIQLVRNDMDLGARARNEALLKSSSYAHKMHKLRAGQRHASVRKRRLMGDASDDLTTAREDPMSPPLSLPLPPPPSVTAIPNRTPSPAPNSFQRFILPRRRNLVYSSPVPLPMQNAPPSPQTTVALRPDSQELPPAPTRPTSQGEQLPRSFSRFRPRENLVLHPVASAPFLPNASEKRVMTDTIGAQKENVDSIMHPLNTTYRSPQETLDNPTKIRSVLAERERILYRLLRRRQGELAAMPLGMTEQTRRKAIIEAKQLSLLDLQRVARYRVCAEMKKMYSLAVQQEGTVPTDHLTRLFRRRDPPIYSYTDGYPRITPFDGIPEMPSRSPTTVAQDSVRMAQFDMSRMLAHRRQRKQEFNSKLLVHYENFQNASAYARNCRARIWKGFERYYIEKQRLEERKRKLERIERLRLLRNNDEQAYLKLLKDTKNERLLQLVRQTDNYLMRIGAQVEKSRDLANEAGLERAHNIFVEELGGNDQVPIEAMRRRRDMYYTVTHSVQEEVRQPSIMGHGTLKGYQLEGLKWMVSLYNNNLNGILADEMGLGKTIQTIALITYLVETKKNPGPFLIIVPLSTIGNWVRELDLWAPSLKKVAYRGDKHTRRAIQQKQMSRGDYNVLITTYEFTVKDQQILSRIHWQYIIIDEGHRMKNANCKLAMTLGVRYKSRNRLLLTGTPLQNNLTELWALLNFLLPTIFSSADTFETWFKQPFESTTLGDTAELEEEETLLIINRLHQVLRPFLLRRLKADVESQLPEKVEHVIRCDMSSWQRVLYRQVQSRIGLATGAHNGSVKSYNNLLMQCKKICNHPYLFYGAEAILDLPPDHLIRASGKFFLLQHMLPKFRLHGHRTLIFSQMTAALDYLEDFLVATGIQYIRLDGNTRADDRQELLNRFNAKDSPYFCFLLSTRAGGVGLNLQSADTVIIFDSDWNPMMDLQAQDRAHRIGQTKVVRVYRLICSGTVEVKILEQANRKLQVDAQVIQAGQFNNQSTELDRHQALKDILRQKTDDGDEVGVVPDMEELNRLFARSDEEFESFCRYDVESQERNTFKSLFEKESELPEWVLQPDMDFKTAEEKEKEILLSHGRGRRQRKATRGVDFTDAEWLKVMEGELTYDEVLERRKRRSSRGVVKAGGTEEKGDGNLAMPSGQIHEALGEEEHVGTARAINGNPKLNESDSDERSSLPPNAPTWKHSRKEAMSLKMKSSGAINGIIVAGQNGRKYVKTQPQDASAEEALFEQTNTVGALHNKMISIRKAQGTLSSRFPVKIRLRKAYDEGTTETALNKHDWKTSESQGKGKRQQSAIEGEMSLDDSLRKRKRPVARSLSNEVVLEEDNANAISPKNRKNEQDCRESCMPEVVTERHFARKRKRVPMPAQETSGPHLTCSMRKRSRNGQNRAGQLTKGDRRSQLGGEEKERSDVQSNNSGVNGSNSEAKPKQSVILQLRIRKEGRRRHPSVL